jgi:hypothetical protein
MKRVLFASAMVLIASAGLAQANTISGSIWTGDATGASNATPANVTAAGSPNVTFTLTETGLNLSADSSHYTIGQFLSSGGGTVSVLTGSTAGTLQNTLFNFTGVVSVTNGQTYSISHDDGVTLIINGVTEVNLPLQTPSITENFTWAGLTGTYSYQLVYGECCGAPAQLVTDLPLNSAVPLPGTLPLLGSGLVSMGLLLRRAKRKRAAAIAA